jgi:hypothetical protein
MYIGKATGKASFATIGRISHRQGKLCHHWPYNPYRPVFPALLLPWPGRSGLGGGMPDHTGGTRSHDVQNICRSIFKIP